VRIEYSITFSQPQCKPNCNCFQCQAAKIKKRNKINYLNQIANEFKIKSGGIITQQDIYNFVNAMNKR